MTANPKVSSSMLCDRRYVRNDVRDVCDMSPQHSAYSSFDPPPPVRLSSTDFASSSMSAVGSRRGFKIPHIPAAKSRNSGDRKPHTQEREPQFTCKNCWKYFNTKKFYDQHLSFHIKCSEENCSFEATPKVLAKHILMTHDFVVRSSPSSDERWLKARKRNFPTAQKVADAKAEAVQPGASSDSVFGSLALPDRHKRPKTSASDCENRQPTPRRDFDDSKCNELMWLGIFLMKVFLVRIEQTGTFVKTNLLPRDQGAISFFQLFHEEKRHETSVLLQCIRYVVQNNFFQAEKTMPLSDGHRTATSEPQTPTITSSPQ
ncbi:unnamed protein product [Soboliphyme baturini]|uniref:C2H2-type domain-containing protein n=1 Tax=Soboliphyme baturini TaxID=241478 RepID=A0A183IMM1_9BILA|nr:unnamed protein product [Soboliphyme baturini]